MTTDIAPTPVLQRTKKERLTHVTCDYHEPDRALCGKDMTGTPGTEYPEGEVCVVCWELNKLPCTVVCLAVHA